MTGTVASGNDGSWVGERECKQSKMGKRMVIKRSIYPARKRNWQLPVARSVEICCWLFCRQGGSWRALLDDRDRDSISQNQSDEGRAGHQSCGVRMWRYSSLC